jgi:biopolymer transport protein ExbD
MRRLHKRRFKRGETEALRLDLTPLIDIIFLLLIFFMVSTTFIKNETALKLNLPQTVTGADLKQEKFFTLVINKEDQIFYHDQKMELKELEQKLKHLPPAQTVVIKADKVAHHGIVVKVMDLLTKNKITNFSFATQKEDER